MPLQRGELGKTATISPLTLSPRQTIYLPYSWSPPSPIARIHIQDVNAQGRLGGGGGGFAVPSSPDARNVQQTQVGCVCALLLGIAASVTIGICWPNSQTLLI